MAEIHQLLAVRRDADRPEADIGRATFHRLEQFGHRVDHAHLVFKPGGGRDLFPEIDRVAFEHAVFLEGEGFGRFDQNTQFFRGMRGKTKDRKEQEEE